MLGVLIVFLDVDSKFVTSVKITLEFKENLKLRKDLREAEY